MEKMLFIKEKAYNLFDGSCTLTKYLEVE